MSVLTASVVVTPDRVLRPGWVRISGDRIDAVGEGIAADPTATDLGDVMLVAGFVDLHCHGGGGASFGDGAGEAVRAADLHLAHGTTTVVASLVTGSRARISSQVDALAPLVVDGTLAGVHLEGPWLSSAQCGAHDRTQLRAPEPDEVDDLVGRDAVRMVTLAPELPGALDAVRRITGLGAIAAIGHTDADYATTRAAIDAGARHATHLFNGMRPLRHRDPGPVVALLDDDRVTFELVRDGVHLDPSLCAWLDCSVRPDRVVAITDAMAAAGSVDGRYALGDAVVVVTDQVARVEGTATIAGSTATMDRIFRAAAGDRSDEALVRATVQTAANPARLLGLDDRGHLRAGSRADLVVLSADSLEVRGVLRAGAWVASGSQS
jgi:N-acetylglucosamine-6-phosphate deacetylase